MPGAFDHTDGHVRRVPFRHQFDTVSSNFRRNSEFSKSVPVNFLENLPTHSAARQLGVVAFDWIQPVVAIERYAGIDEIPIAGQELRRESYAWTRRWAPALRGCRATVSTPRRRASRNRRRAFLFRAGD